MISRSLKVGKQCARAASKGNQILGLIERTFISKKIKYHTQFVQVVGSSTSRILYSGLETSPGQGHMYIGESAKESYEDDRGM